MTFALRKSFDAVLLIAILPVALVLGWQVWAGVRADRDRTQDELGQAAASLAQAAGGELASSIEALTVLARSEIFQQGRISAMGRLLRGRPRRDWDSVFLLDANGTEVLDTATHGSSIPPEAMRTLYAQALMQQQPVVSGVTAAPGIAIATIIQQAGHVRYVLGVRTSDAVWTRLAANATLPPGAEARLYDAHGQAFGGGEGDHEDSYDAWAPVPAANWRARVSLPAAPVDAARRRAIVAALSTSGASLAIGFVLAAIAARRIARGIEAQARAKDEQADRLMEELREDARAIGAAAEALASADPASDAAAEARGVIDRHARRLASSLQGTRKPAP